MTQSDPQQAVLLSEPAPHVRLLTLNLPHLRNAMTEEMTWSWTEALDAIENDRDVRALVVTGSGTSFCSGADLSWLDDAPSGERTPDRLQRKMAPFYRSWLAPREMPFPVIAAINGPAVGAGVCLALACDLRYASNDALFKTPFNFLGTHGGMGITALLPEVIGYAWAREMLYTGRDVLADEALRLGLVTGVQDDVLSYSIDVARTIASAAPIPTKLTKMGLEQGRAGLAAAVTWESLAQPVTMATADLHEGIAASQERRRPVFTGD
ncbi:enoyl-CoA hydratase [Rhodococcus sp. ACPA4]|uniref:enoyl-CoA hydratase/isomerase family protein n=1 Tax=Rhodococcus TaxID=1827 RepID=UPI000BB15ACB|nr:MULTISPECIES: enoyl-CoA hydratase-related protein [Rhodococcus]MDJ0105381.1 enoyl-CoA hydratase-related protein [Rhodococcus erythropolis]PBC43139.1 enoyl-CoA hydratase [Rhodococcus sp. ACPA4]QXW00023.1 enoyl-CoA hydratase/isomerase family protein [Rhodococcus globerulus]RZL22151.1 MAG: enoyl-CoA hydratase/isomerase family protein [Rhodococcus sp. (in: high G+C Gram-positive bacteria)]